MLAIISLFLLVGCFGTQPTEIQTEGLADESPESDSLTVTSTPSSATPTPIPSAISTIFVTNTPKTTQTATLMPTTTPMPTETATIVGSNPPLLTPLPTIQLGQRGKRYVELMMTNNNCQLPCWWGLEMGISTFEEVIQLYSQFEPVITIQNFSEERTIVTIQFVDLEIENGVQTRHTFRGQNDIVLEAEIQVHKHENFNPMSLMEQYEQPSEVWIWTIPEPFQGIHPATFRFYFPEHGILSAYAESARNIEENVEVCFNGDGGSILLLWNPDIWNPDNSKNFTERANTSSELTLEGHQPIDDVSNWDEGILYNEVLNPNSKECLLTPSNLWTSP